MRLMSDSLRAISPGALIVLGWGCAASDPADRPGQAAPSSFPSSEAEQVQLKVRGIMKRLAEGDLFENPGIYVGSGWIMTNEKGASFQRSTLIFQAEKIIPFGKHAVPELVKWLEHGEMQIRYIAHVALEKITGLNPWFPHFASLEQLRTKGWLQQSREEWMNWYTRQP